jgi:septum formation protein
MLEAAEVSFEIAEAGFNEAELKAEVGELPALELARALAERKALSVSAGADCLIIGSDQTLETGTGEILSKAASRDELAEQLRSLRGRSHKLHSAAVVVEQENAAWSGVETVTLRMRDFSDRFLETYLDRHFNEVRWSVGGYHFEGAGAQLFDEVEGSHFAILGLPLLPLLAFLRSRGALRS